MTATIIHGNNLDILPTFDDCSIDAIVTDPPYELGFMGKRWDASGIAYNVTLWQECLRVLKPGGHLLAFGGTRTYHRMACAIEDAGFEIRDSIHWLYGSGFPKSLDVSKAIDKQRHDRDDVYRVTAWICEARDAAGITNKDIDAAFGFAGMAGHWTSAKSQPAVPTLDQVPTLLDVLGVKADDVPADIRRLLWDLNGRKGQPGENWAKREIIGKSDSTLLAVAPGEGRDRPQITLDITAPATEQAKQWAGWGTALKPAHEPIVVARKPLIGTVASNVLEYGTGAINIDASRIGTEIRINQPGYTNPRTSMGDGWRHDAEPTMAAGRWPANVIIDDTIANSHDDWPRYFYCAKPSRKERNAGLNHLDERPVAGASGNAYMGVDSAGERKMTTQNHHPTVKPLALMRYLVRLVTPPGGMVLDPFAGSGTTLMAAILEGFNPIGIEMTDEYLPIIQGRIAWAENEAANTPDQQELDL